MFLASAIYIWNIDIDLSKNKSFCLLGRSLLTDCLSWKPWAVKTFMMVSIKTKPGF